VHILTSVDEEQIARLLERDEFFWVDLIAPSRDEIERLGKALHLHPVALEDTLEFGQRPKLDPYGDRLLLVFYTARMTRDLERPAEPIEVHIYLSGSFIATVRHDVCDPLDMLHHTLAEEGTADEEVIVYRILDALTDGFYPVIEALEKTIDELEGEVLSHPRREHLTRTYRLKQTVHQLHRVVSGQRDQFQNTADAILRLEGLAKSSRPYLRDIGDHLVQVSGEFHRQLDDLLGLTQTYFNANSDRLNAVGTRLTIGGTIFLICTVVTGFFGQNFGWLVNHIASKQAFLTYGVASIVVPTVVLLTLFWFKRDEWF
jgi:magnesium transporter